MTHKYSPPNDYEFNLVARNKYGYSEPAVATLSMSPPGPPEELEMFHIEFWKPRIHFRWTAPSTKTPPVTNYKFYRAIYPSTETELLEASEVPFTKMYTE